MVFHHMQIWKGWAHQCPPWRLNWFKLPLYFHYWNYYKKHNHRIK